jgi:hypothetical protein
MSLDNRQEQLARWITGGTAANGYVAAPASAATITIYDSGSNEAQQQLQVTTGSKGTRFKRVIMSSTSSHDSGASGVSFQASFDNGANWDVVVTYTDTAAGAPNIHYVSVAFPRWRIRYTNSANTLTAWRGCVVGDEYERASQ